MNHRAVLERPQQPDLETTGLHNGFRRTDFHHPDAVERLLARIQREGEVPRVTCCMEDLDTVRRLLSFTDPGERSTEVRTVPDVRREQLPVPVSANEEQTLRSRLGVLPVVLLAVAIVWQLGLWGVTATLTSYAADEAARAAGSGATTADVRDDALRSVPPWSRGGMDVSQTTLGTVKVTSSMPVLAPVFTVDGLDLTSEAPIVAEE